MKLTRGDLPDPAFVGFLGRVVAASNRQELLAVVQQGLAAWSDQIGLYWDADPQINPQPNRLVLDLTSPGGPWLWLVLERKKAYSTPEQHNLRALSQLLGQLIAQQYRLHPTFSWQWLEHLNGLENLHEVTLAGLDAVKQALGARTCLLFIQQGERLRLLGHQGPLYPSDHLAHTEGIAVNQGAAWETYFSGQPLFIQRGGDHPQTALWHPEAVDQPLIYYPIPAHQASRPRLFLEVRGRIGGVWSTADHQQLTDLTRSLQMGVTAATGRHSLERILQTIRSFSEHSRDQTLQALLQLAVELIPGAQAGSLVVRQGSRYYFRAAVGFELEEFSTITFTDADYQRWYGPHTDQWQAGLPRIASNPQDLVARSSSSTPATQPGIVAHVGQIRSNLCLPIPLAGRVMAVLNVDNFFDEAAFSGDSLLVAQLLSRSLAWLLHDSQQREQIREAAYLDTLTGMPNRRCFDRDFPQSLQQAQRDSHILALMMLDLNQFKLINDQLGHHRGDEALTWVARVLRNHLRNHDQLYRWGGDEFVALLPVTSVEAAHQIALRCARAVSEIQLENRALGINVGLSTYPADGLTVQDLLKVADQRMYMAKQERQLLEGGGGQHRHPQPERGGLE